MELPVSGFVLGALPGATLPTVDVAVFCVYLAAVVLFGCWFVRKSRNTEQFTAAGRSLPGWAVGFSVFGTYLSSNTFIGVPGKAYGTNWSFFVFSLSLPVAAFLAAKFFVPFYRQTGEISAYHHFEKRFGPWARTYAAVCYLFTMIGRVASIMFGVSLGVSVLTGWPLPTVITVAGVLITLYTVLGGMVAVIWTDVIQSIILMCGALVVAVILVLDMPGGPARVIEIAGNAGKFSLGSWEFSVFKETVWVILLFGIVQNLNNFGIKQSFIQRYHTAKSERDARWAVWSGALLYIPVSLVFFFIGSSLFSYYHAPGNEGLLEGVKYKAVSERLFMERPELVKGTEEYNREAAERMKYLQPKEYGDKVLPQFIRYKLPTGAAGLLIAAIFAAAMSSIDTSLNSSATIILSDVYKRYINPNPTDKQSMRILHGATVIWGAVGTGCALAMIGVESVLETWWKISAVFSGALLGLFLVGLCVRRAKGGAAGLAVGIGVVVIFWMTFSPDWGKLPVKVKVTPGSKLITAVQGSFSTRLDPGDGIIIKGRKFEVSEIVGERRREPPRKLVLDRAFSKDFVSGATAEKAREAAQKEGEPRPLFGVSVYKHGLAYRLRSPFQAFMTSVIGTLTIFLSGWGVSLLKEVK